MKANVCLVIFITFFIFLDSMSFAGCHLRQYKIKRGDTLSKLVSPEQILLTKKINRVDERHLPVGKVLLIPTCKELTLEDAVPVPRRIKRRSKCLIVFLKKQYFGAYSKGRLVYWGPISSGQKGRETPQGHFKALWRSKHYHSRKYHNAPMPFAICFSNKGYFLHQQALPGRPASHGCVRLLKEDAKWLFSWLHRGDQVIIE